MIAGWLTDWLTHWLAGWLAVKQDTSKHDK